MISLPVKRDDSKPLTKEDFEPYKIVSLWDMLRFWADRFVYICMTVTRLSRSIDLYLREGREVDISSVLQSDSFIADLDQLYTWLRVMRTPMSATAAARLRDYLKNKESVESAKLRELSDDLTQRIMDEFKTQLVLTVPFDRAHFYKKKGTILTEDVVNKWSNLLEDADEAGNCFAFGRYTACVFHLMRIMEAVVMRFGRKVKIVVNPAKDTWFKILSQVKKVIDDMPDKLPVEKRRKARFLASYARLDAVRVAWRNETMHPKATYTAEESEELINAVRLFVKDFSKLR